MKVVCPHCGRVLEIKKDDVMGRYVVCRECHYTFSWDKHVIEPK
jgi:DNA-directed RNA polymerase subunit M/transcription elongation factor TFIIS